MADIEYIVPGSGIVNDTEEGAEVIIPGFGIWLEYSGSTAWVKALADTITLSDAIVKAVGAVQADTITISDVSEFVHTVTVLYNFTALSITFNFNADTVAFNFNAKNTTFNFNAKNKH